MSTLNLVIYCNQLVQSNLFALSVYALNGILSSASFVLDGTVFTASRVSESFDGVHYPHSIYDAGAQILFQSMDWLLPESSASIVSPKDIGSMSNAAYGTILLALIAIGLISHDGFLGFSHLACLFVKGVKPSDLYSDNAPLNQPEKSSQQQSRKQHRNHTKLSRARPSQRSTVNENAVEEIAALLPMTFDRKA